MVKREIKDDLIIFGLRSLKYEIGFNCDEEAASEAHSGREEQFCFKDVMFEKRSSNVKEGC